MVIRKSFLSRRIDRKEFLLYLGFVVLAVTGISGVIKNLSSPKLFAIRDKRQTQSFGSDSYGGKTRKEGL